MRRIPFLTLAPLALLAAAVAPARSSSGGAQAAVGAAAPDFQLEDTDGKTVKLSDFAGKIVVLEWFNPDCPFVKWAHAEGPLEDMAARWTKKKVVWLAVNSSAPGKQGHGRERNAAARKEWGLAHPVLLDEKGHVGRAYGAKTTPHMYVIDAKGNLVYAGALDNAPRGKIDGDTRRAYTDDALAAVLAGKKVDPAETKPYGCSVKYAD